MPIAEIQRFLPPALEGAHVVIGSREVDGASRFDEPPRRHVMGRVFNALVRNLLVPEIQDTQCGFKCFSADAADAIFSRLTRVGFGFDVESLVIARRLGYRIDEIPISWYFDADSRVRMFRDSGGMMLDVLAIWWKERRGCYDRRPSASGPDDVS
ncbi:MAG TPA: hypothetical protein ENI85_19050 [Deltaproteobacteria bacterium]|nr:hypothetical protein [Deltaproteobacteria bacterium]